MSMEVVPTGAQGRWDSTFAALGRSAPAQRADESSTNYLRRLSRVGRKYIPAGEPIAQVNFAELPDSAVPKYSELMREAVTRNMTRTDNMDPADTRYRTVLVTDDNTGLKTRTFYRARTFIDDFVQPCRRVVRIAAPASTALYQASDARRAMAGLF
jgi:hypothetical protein